MTPMPEMIAPKIKTKIANAQCRVCAAAMRISPAAIMSSARGSGQRDDETFELMAKSWSLKNLARMPDQSSGSAAIAA